AGGPAVAVAENVAGETLVPASEAWTSCCCPGVVPSVHWTVVRPEPSVGPLGFERLPPPSVTVNVTVTPVIGLLPASTTSSASADGRVARTTPVCPSPLALMSCAAACATDTVTWPLNPPDVATACALPLPTAVTKPDADTVATPLLSEDQTTLACLMVSARWSSTTATTCRVAPSEVKLSELGATWRVVATGTNGSVPLQAASAMVTNVIGAQRRRVTSIGVSIPAPVLHQLLIVGPGLALLRWPLAAGRFAVVGPAADPARVATAATAAEAFRRIAGAGGPFVSRGDSSGTHVKELALWRAAGVTPAPRWYLESGTDQATTLHLADERRAYALADLPTYAKLGGLASRILFAADTALTNPYTLYVVRRPEPHAAVRDFATWATHAGRERLLALRLPDGTPAFVRQPGECDATAKP